MALPSASRMDFADMMDDVKGRWEEERRMEREKMGIWAGRKTGVYGVQKKSCAGDYSVQLRGAPPVETMKKGPEKVGWARWDVSSVYQVPGTLAP